MNYEDIRLEVADNGFVLQYCEVNPPKAKDCCSQREYRKQVFTTEQGKEALAAMSKMHGTNKAFPMKMTKKEMSKEDMPEKE